MNIVIEFLGLETHHNNMSEDVQFDVEIMCPACGAQGCHVDLWRLDKVVTEYVQTRSVPDVEFERMRKRCACVLDSTQRKAAITYAEDAVLASVLLETRKTHGAHYYNVHTLENQNRATLWLMQLTPQEFTALREALENEGIVA